MEYHNVVGSAANCRGTNSSLLEWQIFGDDQRTELEAENTGREKQFKWKRVAAVKRAVRVLASCAGLIRF